MRDSNLRYRQIHLDFHTSPDIARVGADFDPDRFADTLAAANVDSVTVFARCHHGWLYFDSQRHADRIHPHLQRRDLLREQIEACHARNIRTPIYITVQWDDLSADRHRDWLCIDENGREYNTPPLKAGFYRFLDVFHPGYRRFLFDHVDEVLSTLPTDGIFFDIVQPRPSLARHWLDAMGDADLDPENAVHRARFAQRVIDEWEHEMTAFVRARNGDCSIFYNSGHVGPHHRAAIDAYTHYELESLPSGGWGYMHFPIAARYARGLSDRHPIMGMTGKFHTSWGDFHSYKNHAALRFECMSMLALGGGCSIGDQLHPFGELDGATYDLIGRVYGEVAAKEPWARGCQPRAEIGLMTTEEFETPGTSESSRQPAAMLGAVRMLQELRLQFDIIDTTRDFSTYRLLILPDAIPVDETLAAKLRLYVEGGGSLIATYRSGLNPAGDAFALRELGVSLRGEAAWSPDFLVAGEAMSHDLGPTGAGGEASPLVMYERGLAVEPSRDAEVLASVQRSTFDRTWRHFCSHRHSPSRFEDAGYPGVVRQGGCVYFAHPVFKQYHDNAPRWVKQLLNNAVTLLMPDRLVDVTGPSGLVATLQHQPGEKREVLHLLFAAPERRGKAFDIIEDEIPLHDVKVKLRPLDAAEVTSVRLVPEGEALPFDRDGDVVCFSVPRVVGHAMVEVG